MSRKFALPVFLLLLIGCGLAFSPVAFGLYSAPPQTPEEKRAVESAQRKRSEEYQLFQFEQNRQQDSRQVKIQESKKQEAVRKKVVEMLTAGEGPSWAESAMNITAAAVLAGAVGFFIWGTHLHGKHKQKKSASGKK